jgi:hypothetical protein
MYNNPVGAGEQKVAFGKRSRMSSALADPPVAASKRGHSSMTRIGLSVALFTAALLAASVRAQQTKPGRLGPEDGLLGVVVDGKHAFIDLTGRIVIPPIFDFAWGFSEGLASAWQNGRAGFIDRTGRFVISPRFEYAKAFHEGLAEVKLRGLWGFVKTDGQLAIQPQRWSFRHDTGR